MTGGGAPKFLSDTFEGIQGIGSTLFGGLNPDLPDAREATRPPGAVDTDIDSDAILRRRRSRGRASAQGRQSTIVSTRETRLSGETSGPRRSLLGL